ncbi:MAG: glycosyltransferase family 2 protein [candidate division Zixibacteria bacterium]|nr:glycosyltransferase family 2 protein [Candidatus Tariuqbacter arcticus]
MSIFLHPQSKKLSITIVNTSEKHFTLPCIRSVYDQTKDTDFEIIVTDNNSQDGSVAALREQFPDVIIIENKKNAGFTEANNQSIVMSRGEYIFCLNPDCKVLDGAVDKMVKYMDAHPEAGILGSKLLNGDMTLQPSARNFLYTRSLLLQHLVPWKLLPHKWAGKYVLEYWEHNYVREVDWIIGASLMIRRECVEDIGLKDEKYFIFHEDNDWCWRAHKKGWKTHFLPDAEIIHYGSQTVKSIWGRKLTLEVYKAQHTFIRKNWGEWALFKHRGLLSILTVFRMIAAVSLRMLGKVDGEKYRESLEFYEEALKIQINPPGEAERLS